MITTQIIQENQKPIAVIIDYQKYLEYKKIEEDINDYIQALEIKLSNKKWTSHKELIKELDLKNDIITK